MEFTQLKIERSRYGTDKGKLKATVMVETRYHSQDTAVSVVLPDEVAVELLHLCSEYIVEATTIGLKDVADSAEAILGAGPSVDVIAKEET